MPLLTIVIISMQCVNGVIIVFFMQLRDSFCHLLFVYAIIGTSFFELYRNAWQFFLIFLYAMS